VNLAPRGLGPAAAAEHDSGFFASASSSPSFVISSSPGEVSTGSNAGAVATVTRSLNMSFGNASTTGPGRPLLAV
jgi:hypothetical protein